MPPTKDEVFDKVREALVEALAVDDEEVTPEATMVGDLGAESIDFLDIVFRLEKAFGIEIPRAELFPEDILTNEQFVQDGKVTDDGMKLLREQLPYADLDAFDADRSVDAFANIFTVETLVKFVERKQASA